VLHGLSSLPERGSARLDGRDKTSLGYCRIRRPTMDVNATAGAGVHIEAA
jgi:hypothetical protein